MLDARLAVREALHGLPDGATRILAIATESLIKLVAFAGTLAAVGWASRLGLFPRTRPILPGELAVSD